MDRLIYSREEPWARDGLGLVVSLALCAATGQRLETCDRTSAVWEICTGRKDFDLDVVFQSSARRLLGRIPSIERSLAQQPQMNDLMLCCFPSDGAFRPGFTEGPAGRFGGGFGRGSFPDQPAEVIFCNQNGCPVGTGAIPLKHNSGWPVAGPEGEAFDRSRNGASASPDAWKQGLAARCRAILPATESEVVKLLRSGLIQPSHFEAKSVLEVRDPLNAGFRYVLCPHTESGADKSSIDPRPSRSAPSPSDPAAGFADIVRIIQDGALRTNLVLKTDIEPQRMSGEEVVRLHGELAGTMKAWSRLKSVPMEGLLQFHARGDAGRLQSFLCGLACHLQWNMRARLRRWKGFGEKGRVESEEALALELLRGIRCQEVRADGVGFEQITAPDEDQTAILEALGVKLGAPAQSVA